MGYPFVLPSAAVSDNATPIIDNHIDVNLDYRLLPHVCLVVQAPMSDAMEAMLEELNAE
jgi:hypothetical protein